ncbi:MAG: hypothetical protein PHX27_00420 [Candidatus ainarchaeum sp.]|nr:hypothetical protein [Candidatus ainarchaeum sp.]
MFKKVLLLIFILLFVGTVFSIRLVEPISKELNDNDFVGSIEPGQTLELIISKELGRFNSVELTSDLPSFFNISIKDYLESVKIIIESNERTPRTNYFFSFNLKGKSSVKNVRVFFSVTDSLLDATLLNYSSSTNVNDPANYDLLLINNSDADAKFLLNVNLPWFWLSNNLDTENAGFVIVPKQQKIIQKLVVFPRVQGNHYFKVHLDLQTKNNSKEFTLYSNAKPTLASKFNSSLSGLPFYSISVLPSYFLNSVFSVLFN